jgi:flagellar motor switch protein FliN/FliY
VKSGAIWVVDSWAEELRTVLQFLTAEDWTVQVAEAGSENAFANAYWWTQSFSAAVGAEISIGAPALAWSELGARILQAAGVDLIEQANARSTYIEAVQQSTSGLARAMTARMGRTIDATSGREEPTGNARLTFTATVTCGDFQLPALCLMLSDELCSVLNVKTAIAQKTVSEPKAPPVAPSRTMSVLLDVEMPVSIAFGRSSMQLKEVMKLTTGSAVELDRRADDDVELIVNNCVIARGQVVVVDGNYGVRITEIVSREQRLALRVGGRI